MRTTTVVFTDLDGTLLDHDTYSFSPAKPALQRLQTLRIPIVIVTSKTLPEVLFWRTRLNNGDPFIVENGAAVYTAPGNPPLPKDAVQHSEGYDMVELGVPYGDLKRAPKGAARESGCRVRGFAEMTAQEISRECDLSLEQAKLAKTRQYDEPFRIIKGDPEALLRSVEKRGLRLTRGGRFFHITGHNGKADAVLLLIEAYRKFGPVRTIGLGDGLNDTGFLNLVDYPVLLRSRFIEELRRSVPRGRTGDAGPKGWNESIRDILELTGI